MTKLNTAQQLLLDAVASEREATRPEVARAKLQFEQTKWDIESNLRVIIKLAIEEGVPIRQIGQVLPTSDYKTVSNMAKGANKEFSDRP